jgi:hypothetical protein
MLNFVMKIFFYFTLLTGAKSLFADEYLQACFKIPKNSTFAFKKIQFLKIESDRIEVNSKCIDIYTSSKRKKLFTNYFRVNFKGYYELTSEVRDVVPNCNLQLIKKIKSNELKNKLNLNSRINIKSTKQDMNQNSVTTLKVQNSKESIFSLNNEYLLIENNVPLIRSNMNQISIFCTIKAKGYELKISSLNSENSISTSIYLPFGQTYQLGNILNNSNAKSNSIGISSGLKYNMHKKNSINTFEIKAMNEL